MREINETLVTDLLSIVDAGLVRGVGVPIPGSMCVEAAVCFALGLPHGDDPQCVSHILRELKIRLNDGTWSTNDARAKGLRRLAVVQLGSKDVLDDAEFVRRLNTLLIRKYLPIALRSAALSRDTEFDRENLYNAAKYCESEGSRHSVVFAKTVAKECSRRRLGVGGDLVPTERAHDVAFCAESAANHTMLPTRVTYITNAISIVAGACAMTSTHHDSVMSEFAEDVVKILIDMKVPGCQWLYLTE